MKFKEKILSYLNRKWWYLVLLIFSTIYVLYYRYDIYQFKELNAMNLIFILWLILLLRPLFSEMEFLGIKLKREVEKARAEVKENLNDLRLHIIDLKISNSNANTINFGNGFLPTEQKLKELVEEFITKSNSANSNIVEENVTPNTDIFKDTKVDSNINFDIAEESMYLFKVRLMLEKTLTDLCEKIDYDGHKSIHEMLRYLNRREVINGKAADLISQVLKIANRGIHGEIVSNEYIDFIKKVLPELKKQLNEINTSLKYCICPKCKYTGYSRFENVCPRCGFTSDDD